MPIKLTDLNRLSVRFPNIAAEWHPENNGKWTPYDVSYGSGVKRWWLCDEGHEWEAAPNTRTRGHGCGYCSGLYLTDDNRLSIQRPDIAAEWHPEKNGNLTPNNVPKGTGKRVWWLCGEGHEWEATVDSRTNTSPGRSRGCPECAKSPKRFVNDENRLSKKFPHLVAEWHLTKNGELTPDQVSYASMTEVWWICPEEHEWESPVYYRGFHGSGCRKCAHVSDENRLSLRHPELISEWHPTKNGGLTPYDISYSSHYKYWWSCGAGKGHDDWETSVKNRTLAGSGCPACAGKTVTDENRLSLNAPEVSEEWHPTKNGDRTAEDITVSSNEKVWWQCPKGKDHEWEAVVHSRTKLEAGCPYCAGQKVTDENRLSLNAPEVSEEWHPTKNGDRTAEDITVSSNEKVWWQCKKGHEWEAVVYSRTKNGNGCRQCTLPHRSRIEVYLACELSLFFNDIDPANSHRIPTDNHRYSDVDVIIPSHKLIIEYDGWYWHRKRLDQDIEKTQALKDAGWRVLRIREEPLELVLDTDMYCQVTHPKDIKRLVNNVLNHLTAIFDLEIAGRDDYLKSDSLAKRELAEEIIGRAGTQEDEIEIRQLNLF